MCYPFYILFFANFNEGCQQFWRGLYIQNMLFAETEFVLHIQDLQCKHILPLSSLIKYSHSMISKMCNALAKLTLLIK